MLIENINDTYPIIGMSPGNSYFKYETVKKLLKNVIDKYGKTLIFIADVPAINTYIALGYPENIARKNKAIPQGNNLKNKVVKAMNELGLSDNQVRIIDWKSEVEPNIDYQEKYQKICSMYEINSAFKSASDEATAVVLNHTGKTLLNAEKSISIGVKYLLSEFAFLEFAPQYLNSKSVTYIYHKKWDVYESYRRGEFDGIVRDHLNFEIIVV